MLHTMVFRIKLSIHNRSATHDSLQETLVGTQLKSELSMKLLCVDGLRRRLKETHRINQ